MPKPKLATSVKVRWTRLGWQFAFIGVFAMIGGAVRAYNLPLVLAGLIVAAMILHWRWARQTIVGTAVRRRMPDEAFAGQPFVVRFMVTNRLRWLPLWLVRVDDSIRRIRVVDSEARRGIDWRMTSWRAKKPDDTDAVASCGVGVVTPGKTATATYECLISRRGRYDFGPVTLSTGAPIGLMTAQRRVAAEESFYVFPAFVPLNRHWRRQLQTRTGGNSTTARRSGVQDGEFFGIRSWQAGDSRRWIHWRTTARIGEPAVRQFEQLRRFEVCVLVDGYLPPGEDSAGGQSNRESLERVISVAASLVTQLVATPTNKIGLVLAGERAIALASGGGRDQTVAMLCQLAELEGCAEPDLAESLRQIYRIAGRPRDLVVLSPRTFDQVLGERVMGDRVMGNRVMGDRETSAAGDKPIGGDLASGGAEKRAELRSMMGGGSAWRWFSVADRSLDLLAAADDTVAPASQFVLPSSPAVPVAAGEPSRQ